MTAADRTWRLLLHPAADGAWNMAVDEAILESYADSTEPLAPTLRLYGWRPPALSLGRGQRAHGAHDPRFLERCGIDLVRRPTGGRAVLHEHERTYAVIGRLGVPPFSGGVIETYARVAEALVAAMRSLGVPAQIASRENGRRTDPGPACFTMVSAHEVTAGGRKLIGSAQLRRRGAFLQHGSIPLRCDPQRLAGAVGSPSAADGFTDLGRELGRVPGTSRLDRVLAKAFAQVFSARLAPGELSARENTRAQLLRHKYGSAAWTG